MIQNTPSAAQIALFQQASALRQSGKLLEAGEKYQSLLDSFPDDAIILSELGIIKTELTDYTQAELLLTKSLTLQPNQAYSHFYVGVCFTELNNLTQAVASFDQAIALKSDFAYAYYCRGNVLQDLQQHQLAVDSFTQAISLQPDMSSAYNNLGLSLQAMEQYTDALANFEKAVQIKADNTDALHNLGLSLDHLNNLNAAVAVFQQAISFDAYHLKAYMSLGNTQLKLKRFKAALDSFIRVTELAPDYAEAYNNCGIALQNMHKNEAPLAYFQRAIALKPDYVEAHLNCGIALHDLDHYQAALACFEHAISLNPSYAEAYNNRGHLFNDLQQFTAAEHDYQQAIRLNPQVAAPYLNLGLLKLLCGDFETGWELYEWRWRESQLLQVRNFTQPLWLGKQSLSGKTLLIHAEQGLGDFIQFCRYVNKLESLAAEVILEVPRPLLSLARSLEGNFRLLTKGDNPPAFDLHCPLMSLPLACDTRLDTIPADLPYLYANPDLQQHWQQQLGPNSKKRIGLVWSGSPSHKNDHRRSIPLCMFSKLFTLPLEFHCLQTEIRPADLAWLADYPAIHLHQAQLHDFADTAALIANLDLVISIDTSVAHLAGALGKPTWILLPYVPDFRWLTDRSDSPWYPTAHLWRQTAPGDWQQVIATIHASLADQLSTELFSTTSQTRITA